MLLKSAILLIVVALEAEKTVGVFNGHVTEISSVPYQVQVENAKKEFQCSGVVYNNRTVIAPLACLSKCGKDCRVRAGTGRKGLHGMVHTGSFKKNGDIGLLLLDEKTPLYFSLTVASIPVSKSQVEANTAYVSGWGCVSKNISATDQLYFAQVEIQPLKNCSGATSPNNLCAGNGKASACGQGDFGAPLMAKGYLIGIFLDDGINTAKSGRYANITNYYNWIEENATKQK